MLTTEGVVAPDQIDELSWNELTAVWDEYVDFVERREAALKARMPPPRR